MKSSHVPTALIADDEPLLRRGMVRMLAAAWPELEVVAQARNGREAVELFDRHRPAICFLDVHMPGLTGVDAARLIGRQAHLVFVTAFDRYAVEAFEQGAIDYLVKPVEPARLADTVSRLKERLQADAPQAAVERLLAELAGRLGGSPQPAPLRWLRASVGTTLRIIDVDRIDFLRADAKYTRAVWRDEGRLCEALVRTPIKDLLAQLDPAQFVQVHRSTVVAMRAIDHVVRGDHDTATIHLTGHDEVLPVSRRYLHLFRQM